MMSTTIVPSGSSTARSRGQSVMAGPAQLRSGPRTRRGHSTSAGLPPVYGRGQSHRRGVGSVQQRRTLPARQGAQHGRRCGATGQHHAVAASDPLGPVILAPCLGSPPLDHEMAALCGVLVDHIGSVAFRVSRCQELHTGSPGNDSGLYDSRYRVDGAATLAMTIATTQPAQHNPAVDLAA